MKTAKRVISILLIIILAFIIGYIVYTGSQLADVINKANGSIISACKGAIIWLKIEYFLYH